MSSVSRSYRKTLVACTGLTAAAIVVGLVGWRVLPTIVGRVILAASALSAAATALFACAAAIVVYRDRREARGKRDLYLDLNRTREPAAIDAWAAPRSRVIRRWLSRRLYGQDLLVGDVVEVKSWQEIRQTLDASGCLDALPFMPEMLAMCGRRAAVFRCAHRIFDYRKSRRMRHVQSGVLLVRTVCDGSRHGGCEAACHTIWKPEWLRRLTRSPEPAAVVTGRGPAAGDAELLDVGTRAPVFICQLTRLHDSSVPVGRWNFAEFILPALTGNVTAPAFAVGWLTFLFNALQVRRGGVAFPAFDQSEADPRRPGDEADLRVGEIVTVKSSKAIRGTLNAQLMHRGMWFEPDMLKHCAQRFRVQSSVTRLVDIVSGEMRTMKTPAYILEGVHFSGERQLFNAQYEPLFWRAAWLEHETADGRREPTVATGSPPRTVSSRSSPM